MSKSWRNNHIRLLAIEAVKSCKEAIVFDTETSGLDSLQDRIIEIAAIKISLSDFKKIDELHKYIRPPFMISEKIEKLTGITNDMLSEAPFEEDVYCDIQSFFGSSPSIIVAHNSAFDMRFLTALAERNKGSIEPYYVLDTLEMARDRIDESDTDNYKLGTLARLMGLDEGIQFHSALDDAFVTSKLFEVFAKEYESTDTIYKCGNYRPIITHIGFWEGYRGFSRIYVQTDVGSVYYDIRRKRWYSKDADIDKIDMNYVETRSLKLTNSSTIEEFAKYRGK